MCKPFYSMESFFPLFDSNEGDLTIDSSSVIVAIKKDVENFEDHESIGEAYKLLSLNVVFDYTFDDALNRLLEAIEGCERMLTTHKAASYIELYQRLLNTYLAKEKHNVEVQIEKAIMELPTDNRLQFLENKFKDEKEQAIKNSLK